MRVIDLPREEEANKAKASKDTAKRPESKLPGIIVEIHLFEKFQAQICLQ